MSEKENINENPAGTEINAAVEKSNGTPVKRSLFRKIVNSFIAAFLILVLFTMVLIGFTQTKTFREYLREKVISLVNEELNGKLNIESIDGTIITSLTLRNTSIVMDNDTILFARKLEIRTSPAQLLLKKIFVRKLLLEDVKIQMLQDSKGEWNIAKLVKPTPEDTSKSTFSFIIQAPDIQLKNVHLIKQSYSKLRSHEVYKNMNYDDIRINNFNLTAEAFADIENSNYLLILKELSFKPNLARFNLRYISGEFAITKEFASVNKFYCLTDSSEINLNARIDSLNLLGNVSLEDFKNYPVTINFAASPFNFDDLSSFINATEILKGNPSLELHARGKFGGFTIDRAAIEYRDTKIDFSGQVLNLNVPSRLYLKAKITDTDINYKNINALMPNLQLPEYAKMILTGVNIEYEGEPTNFKTKFLGNVDDGMIEGEGTMNVSNDPMTYDISIFTENLNLFALSGINTRLNGKCSISGQGTSPMDLAANIRINLYNTSLNNINIDKFDFEAQAKDRLFKLDIDTEAEGAKSIISGNLVYSKDTVPSYSVIGDVHKLDLSKFTEDEKQKSNLNLYFSVEGSHFNPDDLQGTFAFGVDSSYFQDKWINSSIVEAKIAKDSLHRDITLSSDFVDFKIDGNFSLNKAIELVTYESKTISQIITAKIKELNPLNVIQQPQEIKDTIKTEPPAIINEDIAFNYDFKFKDFELIALLMENDQLDIAGYGSGSVTNKNSSFSFNSDLNLDYIIMMQKGSTIYLSDFEAGFNFTRDNRSDSFDKLFGSVSITGKRLYTGSNIKNLSADAIFNQSKLFFNVSVNYDDFITTEAEGLIKMTPLEQQFMVSDLSMNIDGVDWKNKDTLKALFNPNYFKVVQCQMKHDTTLVSANGIIQNTGDQNLSVNAFRISGDVLEKYFFGLKNTGLIANGSVDGKITGKFADPIMSVRFTVSDLELGKSKLGNIKGSLFYQDKKMKTNFAFLNSIADESNPLFLFDSMLPINLSFSPNVQERLLKKESLYIKLTSNNFNLSQLGKAVPFITDQQGILKADVRIGGTFEDPTYSGFVNLYDGYFKSIQNNLDYSCRMKLTFETAGIKVDSLALSNAGGTKYPGTMNGVGTILFDGFNVKDVNLRFYGDIAVMSQQSQSVSPLLYGDLQIATDGDWLLTKKGERLSFKGDVLMKKTDLVYRTGAESGVNTNNNFNFIFVVDSSKIDKEQVRFEKVLAKEKSISQNAFASDDKDLNFDYTIGIKAGTDAKLTFILGQALNQKLIVEMRGGMSFENIENAARAQGSFELLQGSRLEFFKVFDATGFLRFESDITNPYLDIVATYKADYIDPRDQDAKSQEVAIKIKIHGPLSELGKNLANDKASLGVYVGSRNIQDNVTEPKYDYADALSFILMGKFKDDLTAQDKAIVAGQTQNAIGSTATSFLGTVLTSFVNSAVGDLINNISITQSGESTKFSLSGKIQNFSYSIGGKTETIQNLSRANIMGEYSFYPTNLKLRFERRDPIGQTTGLDEKILEFILKYRFEF